MSVSTDRAFGTIDLNTGVFTVLGNTGQTLSGMGVENGSAMPSAPLLRIADDSAAGLAENVNAQV
jgi:hypothetical protein